MADKDFDLDKILSDSFNRLDKIGSGAGQEDNSEKADLSKVSFGSGEMMQEQEQEDTLAQSDNVGDEPLDDVIDDIGAEALETAEDNFSDGEDLTEDHDPDAQGEIIEETPEYSDDEDSFEDEEYPQKEEYYDDEDDFVEEYKDVAHRDLQFNMDKGKEKKKKKRKKKRVRPNNSIFVGTLIAVIVISISFILSFLSIQFGVEYIGLTRSEESITFDVPTGTGVDTIGDLLYQKGIIDNPTMFKFVMRISGKTNIIPGSITLSPNMTYPSIITELNRSRKVYETVSVTFTEGMSLYRASKLLEEKEVCTAEEFLEAFNKDSGFSFENDLELTPQTLYQMEGFMFPDTYEFYKEDEPENVVSKIKSNFESKMGADKMALVEKSGLSLYEVITLASIVQAEADTPENMRLVASVFLNRLENKAEFPYLQSDATYFYVTNTVASALGNTAVSSYEYLYSTYSCYGLPIGPIGNPGMDAINAVLEPEATEYYYFVTDSVTGEFYYAATYEEHEENVKKAGY